MRHSVEMAQRNYRKVIEEKPVEKQCEEIKLENEVLNNKLANCEAENKVTDVQYSKY